MKHLFPIFVEFVPQLCSVSTIQTWLTWNIPYYKYTASFNSDHTLYDIVGVGGDGKKVGNNRVMKNTQQERQYKIRKKNQKFISSCLFAFFL